MKFNSLTTPGCYIVLFPVFSELEPLRLILYLEQHVWIALAALKGMPLYNKVLCLGQLEHPEEEEKGASTSSTAAVVPTASTSGAISSASMMGSPPPSKKPHQSPCKKGRKGGMVEKGAS